MNWQVAMLRYVGLWLVVGCVLFGCAPANRLVHYAEADVLFTTPAEVDRLCKLAPGAGQDRIYLGSYFPAHRLAVVPHDSADVLGHELRHARDDQFHR